MDELIKEYEEKQKIRRQTRTMEAIDRRIFAKTLIATGIHGVMKPAEDTAFTYKIDYPARDKAKRMEEDEVIWESLTEGREEAKINVYGKV